MPDCKQCHFPNDEGAVYCVNCGHEIMREPERARRTQSPRPGGPSHGQPAAPISPETPSVRLPAVNVPPVTISIHLVTGERFLLREKSDYIIGRVGDEVEGVVDVDLSQFNAFEAGVSRQHLALHARPEGVFVEDLESMNETIHNGYRLLPHQWYPLRDGDELRLGALALYVVIR